ncbi:DUF397 domain-containing protein [Streptomyces sp. uw30]|uniref:DUF397 domain-containing protein n=1 Tax=Streptomyces sp. uw30 TaxID=1828179 RepID=UPI0011CEB9CA|nr:DUF397 domain-containing protein [Streptomyces sp. uw30]TXS35171.1 DUF397 domain-containing protein [Streptomyces sp. uw30]
MSDTPQPVSELFWFKSSYSGGNTTECLEAAFTPFGVLVRDSKQPKPAHIVLSAQAWSNFLTAAYTAD